MFRRFVSAWADVWATWVARWPWWAGLVVAVPSYALLLSSDGQLHWPAASHAGGAGPQWPPSWWQAAQFLLPLLGVLASVTALWRQWQWRGSAGRLQPVSDSRLLRQLGVREFERLVAEAFRQQGYEVVERADDTRDGPDLLLRQGRQVFLLRCKHWRAPRVGVEMVREFMALVAAHEASGGFVVTCGRFSKDARRTARALRLQLLDGPRLRALLRTQLQGRLTQIGHPTQSGHSLLTEPLLTQPPASAPVSTDQSPPCPRCGSPMILRSVQPGSYSGQGFWGCPQHPACKGTRPLA